MERIADLRKRAAANERDRDALKILLFEESLPDEKALVEMEAAGVRRIIATIYNQSREEALPTLDRLAKAS